MIEKITKKQEALIPEYIQKWVDLASRPIDREKAKQIIKEQFGSGVGVIFAESIEHALTLIKKRASQEKYTFYLSYYLYSWAGYYDYAKYIGVKFDENKLKQYFDTLLNIPICIFTENTVFVVEKPQCLWLEGKLHSETQPAINWKDGTGYYYLHGVNFEKGLWEKIINKTITPKEIFNLENQEQKSVAIRVFGYDNLVKDAKVLSEQSILQDGKPTKYQVLEYDLKDDEVPAKFVKVKDWSGEKFYLLRIDPRNSELAKDPVAAVAQTFVKPDGKSPTKEEFLKMGENPT